MTNVLALPLVQVTALTGNNEDWIDSLLYVAPAEGQDPALAPQVDLRGIEFDMVVRVNPGDAEVILAASTVDGTLSIGTPPNYGYLFINISRETMKLIA